MFPADHAASTTATRRYDVQLGLATLLLLAYGLVMVWSASAFVAQEETNNANHFVIRQLVALSLGAVGLFVARATPYRHLQKYVPFLYALSIGMLLAVGVPGLSHSANGAQRWIGFGGFHFQPAELAKASLLVCFAAYLHKHRANLHDIRGVLLPAVGWAIPPLALIIVQPDFGSTVIILGLGTVMLVLAGLRLSWVIGAGVALAALVAPVMWFEAYRRERVMSFLDPFSNCSGSAYQVCESLLAMHHGGVWGQGLGDGVAKLLYLPEPYNDFIAAVIGEELGLWGFALLTGLYAWVAWRGFEIARRSQDMFGVLLASTFTLMIVGQACLNLGVVLSLLPPKGLVLPFISYGASAMIINLTAVGVLLSISADMAPEEAGASAGRFVGA